MADRRHFENHYLVISPYYIVRLKRNLKGRSRITRAHITKMEI